VGRKLPPEAFESGLDARLSPEVRRARAINRRLFREMIKDQFADRPMSWWQRRALVRFAAALDIESFEARLIIRGVEYECGHVAPAAMADVQTPVKTEYLIDGDSGPWMEAANLRVILAWVIALICLITWLAG